MKSLTPLLAEDFDFEIKAEEINILATKEGEYNALLTLYHNSKPGNYNIVIDYLNSPVGSVSFEIIEHQVPEWIKNNARWWSTNEISDSIRMAELLLITKTHKTKI